jgi:hypothetical protein
MGLVMLSLGYSTAAAGARKHFRIVPSHRIRTLLKSCEATIHRTGHAPISALAACAILAVLIQVYAGASLRGLYADGAFFAGQLAAHEAVGNFTRVTSGMIIQWPVMAAMHLGVETPHSVALVYSFVTNLLPGLIILLCLPAMPTAERHFFIFPCFVYFAGILSAQFASVMEGLVATSYFWLLLSLIAFGRLTILRLAFIAVFAVGSVRLHEQMLFLGPILIVSCVMRLRREPRLLSRSVLLVAALCALAATLVAAHDVIHPIDVAERNSFFSDFLALHWLYVPATGCNLPCALGILAAACILLTMLRPAWGLATTWIFAGLSIPVALATFWVDWLIVPVAQFIARYNGALMSLPLAVLLLLARLHTPLATAMTRRPARGIVILLGLAVSLWHIGATEQWSAFLTHFSNVLQSRDGIIAWDTVAAPPGSREAALAGKIVWGWTNPDLSLLALPRSCVNSVIANPTWYVGWEPHTLSNLATMPAFPGITYTYLLPSDQQRAACPAV